MRAARGARRRGGRSAEERDFSAPDARLCGGGSRAGNGQELHSSGGEFELRQYYSFIRIYHGRHRQEWAVSRRPFPPMPSAACSSC